MEKLIGRFVTGLRISPYKDVLVVDTDAGPYVYEAYGDCCSTTWYEHIVNASALRGEVMRVEELNLPNEDDTGLLKVYGYMLHTALGSTTIEFRNESNGYYGGSLFLNKNRDGSDATQAVDDDF